MAYGRSRGFSVLDAFTLSPLPYPVLLILAVMLVFLGTSWYLLYEEVIEAAEEQLGWVLFAMPVVLVLIVRWLSSVETSSDYWRFLRLRKPHQHHLPSSYPESISTSPWAVAAVIVLLLIPLQYQSTFLDNWFL